MIPNIPYLLPGAIPGTYAGPNVAGTCLPLYTGSLPQPPGNLINCNLSSGAQKAIGLGFAGLAVYALFGMEGSKKLIALPAAWLAFGHLFAAGGGL